MTNEEATCTLHSLGISIIGKVNLSSRCNHVINNFNGLRITGGVKCLQTAIKGNITILIDNQVVTRGYIIGRLHLHKGHWLAGFRSFLNCQGVGRCGILVGLATADFCGNRGRASSYKGYSASLFVNHGNTSVAAAVGDLAGCISRINTQRGSVKRLSQRCRVTVLREREGHICRLGLVTTLIFHIQSDVRSG